MKNLLKFAFLFLVTLIMSCADNCDDVECGLGTCDDGTCVCPEGYEGTSCETLSNAKYYGTWVQTSSDCGAGNTSSIDSIAIAAHPNGNPIEVQYTSFSSSFTGTIDGTIVNGSLAGLGEIMNTLTEVSGTFTTDTELESELTAGGFNCDIFFEKN